MTKKTVPTTLVWASLALALGSSPALADQFVEAADNAGIECVLSRGELIRRARRSGGACVR